MTGDFSRALWGTRGVWVAAAILFVSMLAFAVKPADAACPSPPCQGDPNDTVPPTVQDFTPLDGATDVLPGAGVTVTFSESMDPATIDAVTFTLSKGGSGTPLPAAVDYDATTDVATLNPEVDLDQGDLYTATVTTGVKDLNNNPLETAATWSFRVADVSGPTVDLVKPLDGQKVGTSVTAEADASDNLQVDRVEFFVDGLRRATDEGAPYEATLDMGGYAHGSSHAVTVLAFDGAGNRASSAAANVTVDREVSLDLGDAPAPGGFTNAASVPLSFTTDADVVRRECRVVPGGFASCSSPYTPDLASDGPYTYEVKATDDVGNQRTSSRAFTLDRTAPTLAVNGGPDGGIFGPGTTQAWDFSAGDATSGPPEVRCSVVPAGAEPIYETCATASSHSVSNRGDGSHEFRLRATDGAGNQKVVTRAFTIDATAPSATLTAPVGGAKVGKSMQLAATAADERGAPKIEFLVDGEVKKSIGSAPYETTLDMVANGYEHGSTHTVAARAVDGAGNRSALSEAAITVDRQVELSLGDSPTQGSQTNAASVPLSFTTDADVPDANRECQALRAGAEPEAFAPCTTPTTFTPGLTQDGSYTYRIKVTDDVGNSLTRERTFTLDRTLPNLTVNGPADQVFGPGTTQTWTFSADDATSGPARVECSVVPAGAEPNYGPCRTTRSHSVSNKPDGSYEFTIRATDGAANARVQTRTFAIDATPPGVEITSGLADNARTNKSSLTWTFSALEANSTFECRFYPEPLHPRPEFGACSGVDRHTASGLSAGSYVLEVRARDEFGNVDGRPLMRHFIVDTVKPRVLAFTPASKARNVAPSANVIVAFSERMQAGPLVRNLKLTRAGSNKPVAARITLDQATNRATLNPTKRLARGAAYRAVVTAGARDLANNPLLVARSWTFKVR